MQCLSTFRQSTSPLHRRCYSSQQDVMRTRPAAAVRTRLVRAPGVCSRAHAPAHRNACGRRTRSLGSGPPSSSSRRRPADASRRAFSRPAHHRSPRLWTWTVGFDNRSKKTKKIGAFSHIRWAGGSVLLQPPWNFEIDSQTRGTRENRAPPCVKVPGSSRVPLHCSWNAITMQSIRIISVQARGILPRPEEQSRTCG
jgi:hypothetical protein